MVVENVLNLEQNKSTSKIIYSKKNLSGFVAGVDQGNFPGEKEYSVSHQKWYKKALGA